RHRWDARKARDEEYYRIAESLLKIVGETCGAKREDNIKVVIWPWQASVRIIAPCEAPSIKDGCDDQFHKTDHGGYIVKYPGDIGHHHRTDIKLGIKAGEYIVGAPLLRSNSSLIKEMPP
ncbi:hypothetical protein BGZ65_012232, partial [Modicella reniformis]